MKYILYLMLILIFIPPLFNFYLVLSHGTEEAIAFFSGVITCYFFIRSVESLAEAGS
ncbi:MAG: hypothetical protein IJQ82_08345 [Selenomonadaceae bacterium]|nr:hypothetical protein [Selenomonadaceae bacterium]